MNRNFRRCFLSLALIVAICAPALADGVILPVDPENRERFLILPPRPAQNFTVPMSITKHHVKVAIADMAAETSVDQLFYNHENRTVEGLYIFPLPAGASISGFAMDIDGKITKGELLDAGKARSIYENIVAQMRDPGLLEFMGTGLFKTRIYPIEGLKNKQVKLDYQEALKVEGNLIRYVYPLNIERFTQEPMKDVAIEVKISSKTPITSIYSPTHSISIHRHGEHEATVGFEAESLRPEKDFVLYYAVSQKELSLSCLTHRPDPTEDGTFMMMLSPRVKEQNAKVPAVDIALVMDTSGSMAGKKMKQARKALEFCLNAMADGNRFALISFSTEAESYKPALVEMNEDTRTGALAYVKRMDPSGGTNISEALLLALNILKKADGERPKFVIFVTDGKPTAGFTLPKEIMRAVEKANTHRVRLFTFGVGDQLNAQLLDDLAGEHGGVSDYVSENEDIEQKVSELFSKLTHPVLTDLNLEFHNVEVSQVYPRRLPDVFKGTNLLILGRYSKPGEARITLSGQLMGKSVTMDFETSFPRASDKNGFVPRIWASRKIGFLLEQIRKNGEDDELKTEIVKLAKRFGILTPYTSFLVVEDKDLPGPRLREAMAPSAAMPEEKAKFDRARDEFSMDSLQSQVDGERAVGASREMNALKSAAMPRGSGGFDAASPHQVLKKVGMKMPVSKEIADRTFYHLEDRWVDSSVTDETPAMTVKAYSRAYFELLKREEGLGKFLALGNHMLIRIKGKTIEIHPDKGIENPDQLSL